MWLPYWTVAALVIDNILVSGFQQEGCFHKYYFFALFKKVSKLSG